MEIQGPLIAGVDEVGRGPLAGPVVVAAVILHPDDPIDGLADSKSLTERQREILYTEITTKALSWAVAQASVAEIDRINILQASLLAMQRAVAALAIQPDGVMVDGREKPKVPMPVSAIIGGDATVPVISAASIIAKVTRDREMVAYETLYPGYDFANNKGYGTKKHQQALQTLGATPIHRRSFAPVKAVLAVT